MSSKPSFVFVPGAWHAASTWSKVTALLESQGYTTTSVTLPTTEGTATASFGDDVKATQDAIKSQTSSGSDVALVHGGVVGQSAMKGFTKSSSNGLKEGEGHIIGLIVIASGYAQPGMAFLDGTGGTPPPTWRLAESGFAELNVPARALFYDDLPEAEGEKWASGLTKQSSKAFTEGGEVAYPGWKDVPVWHLLTMEDKALPVDVQRMLVDMVQGTADVTVREMASSHSPMLSRPEEVVEFILDASKALTKTRDTL